MDQQNPASRPTMANLTPLSIGAYALRVRDIDKTARFYRDIVGLDETGRDDGTVRLGAGGVTLLHLEHAPDAAPDDTATAGLFHAAFVMPTRRLLADWYLHARDAGTNVTRTGDHAVNEAIYYDDPEGNGCECYVDRPPESWIWLDDGTVDIPTAPVDLDRLIADASDARQPWRAPDGLRVGHINLRVGEVEPSIAYWRDGVGLDFTGIRDVARFDGQISFLSSGRYHHHIATNDFMSTGAGPRDPNRAGLAWFEILARSDQLLDEVRARLTRYGAETDPLAEGFETADPWGTRVRFIRTH